MNQLIKYSICLLSLISCLSVVSANASTQSNPEKINFRSIMQNQDFALGEVESILQDHEGFMWLGGHNDPTSISNNVAWTTIQVDVFGWAGPAA